MCELVALFPISQPAGSGHLRRLKDAGWIEDERRGMWVYYHACPKLPPLVRGVLDEIEMPRGLEAALQEMDGAACCAAAATSAPANGQSERADALRRSPPITETGPSGERTAKRRAPA